MLSTPWGQEGVHYEKTEELWGELGRRGVAFRAPTWVLNDAKFPDEASTRAFEEDERIWRREWAAIPGEHDSAAFAPENLVACKDVGVRYRDPVPGVRYAIGYDEGGRNSARALVVAHDELRSIPRGDHARYTVVDLARRWEPGRGVDHDRVMAEVAAIAKRYNGAVVQRDLFAGDAVGSALTRHSTVSTEVSMSPQQQAQRFRDLQTLVETHRLRLVDNEDLLREMRSLRETLHQGGRISFQKGTAKGFDDLVDALALAAARSAKLPPGGGDIVILKPAELYWKREDPRGYVPATYGRRLPNGEIVPCAPPPGIDADIARAERFAMGIFTAEDEALLGIEEIHRRMQNGGEDPREQRRRGSINVNAR
jgi:hypothetical protein